MNDELKNENYYQNSVSTSHYSNMYDSIVNMDNNGILIDKISNKYILNDKLEFYLPFLKKYENLIKEDLYDLDCPSKYFYKPEYLSEALYGTTDLWYILLFVNDMKEYMDFCKEKIKVPYQTILEKLNTIINNESLNSNYEKYNIIYKNYSENPFKLKYSLENKKDIIQIKEKDFYKNEKKNSEYFKKYVDFKEISTTYNYRKSYDIDNKKLCDFFSLDSDSNLICYPSNYKSNNYLKRFSTKLLIENDYDYRIVKLYNGICNFSLNNVNIIDDKNNENTILPPELTFNINEDYLQQNEYQISPNNENNNINFYNKNETWDIGDDIERIRYEYTIGGYLLRYVIDNENKSNKTYLKTPKFNLKNRDINNNGYFFKDKDFIEIEMQYQLEITDSEDKNNDLISPLNIELYVNDEYKFSYNLKPNKIFRTDGKFASIKRIIPLYKLKDEDENFHYRFSYNCSDTNINNNLIFEIIKISLRGVKLEDISIPINKEICNITEDNYYNFNYSYSYNDNYEGIYFEPLLLKSNNGVFNIDYNTIDDSDQDSMYITENKRNLSKNNSREILKFEDNKIKIKFKKRTFYGNDTITTIMTDYKLPENFIIDFSYKLEKFWESKLENNLGGFGLLLYSNDINDGLYISCSFDFVGLDNILGDDYEFSNYFNINNPSQKSFIRKNKKCIKLNFNNLETLLFNNNIYKLYNKSDTIKNNRIPNYFLYKYLEDYISFKSGFYINEIGKYDELIKKSFFERDILIEPNDEILEEPILNFKLIKRGEMLFLYRKEDYDRITSNNELLIKPESLIYSFNYYTGERKPGVYLKDEKFNGNLAFQSYFSDNSEIIINNIYEL